MNYPNGYKIKKLLTTKFPIVEREKLRVRVTSGYPNGYYVSRPPSIIYKIEINQNSSDFPITEILNELVGYLKEGGLEKGDFEIRLKVKNKFTVIF